MNNRRRLVALLLTGAVLAGCRQHPPTPEATFIPEETVTMDTAQLPTLKESIAPMLDLIDAVRREISQEVPATAPWRWAQEYQTISCGHQSGAGLRLHFPFMYSDHGFTEDEWARVLPAVTRLAGAAGLTGGEEGPMNKPGNHDVTFSSDDGRTLRLMTRVATLVTATVGCRRAGDDLWVDGRVPMPPAPQP